MCRTKQEIQGTSTRIKYVLSEGLIAPPWRETLSLSAVSMPPGGYLVATIQALIHERLFPARFPGAQY
jgi:hypothetical protein